MNAFYINMAMMVTLANAAEVQANPVFAPCAACHSVKPGKNGIGPSLHNIVGAKKAAVPKFNYSPAMKSQKGRWTEAELNAFLANPLTKVPRSKMMYRGISDAATRAKLIVYLKSLK